MTTPTATLRHRDTATHEKGEAFQVSTALRVYDFAKLLGEHCQTDFGSNCFLAGVEISDILTGLGLDSESIAAGLLYPVYAFTDLKIDDIKEQVSDGVGDLVFGVDQLSAINLFQKKPNNASQKQTDNTRKMLLAMVRDVRVVVIKLVEHLSRLRVSRDQPFQKRQRLALETKHIFAPLAARLGLEKIKWELEDLSFRELDESAYQSIAKQLAEKRIDREKRIRSVIQVLTQQSKEAHIKAPTIYGRPKHIYSIYHKMQRKDVPFNEIFDANAVRILVDTEKECYQMLSFVHETWEPIAQEFDDYIANPKPNGYQSIHTAIFDDSGKSCEVQIRTRKMHEQAESGVAAHWFYKENGRALSSFDVKIDWLRSLLDWYKDLAHDESLPEELDQNILDDRVYVFTPSGDVLDMSMGSTPLDFAYHIHTEVGHRCRGAKIDGNIVTLIHLLKTGDRVEIITTKHGAPSRDWLIPQRGYLKTASARAKVFSWFKKQDYDLHVSDGRGLIGRECQRLNINDPSFNDAANQLKFTSTNKMFAALGSGSLRLVQIMNVLVNEKKETLPLMDEPFIITKTIAQKSSKDQVLISGVGNLLSHLAKCCKPVPGDSIIGYITQGRGVAIHHRDCNNIAYASQTHADRLIQVEWNDTAEKTYPIDVKVSVYNRVNIIRDISNILSNEKINILGLNTKTNTLENVTTIFLTIEINSLERLGKVLDHLHQMPNVFTVQRI